MAWTCCAGLSVTRWSLLVIGQEPATTVCAPDSPEHSKWTASPDEDQQCTVQGFWYFAEKKNQNFAGFSRANSRTNRPISQEISGGGGGRGNFAKKQSVNNSQFCWIFLANFAKINSIFASIWPALFNVFLKGIIIKILLFQQQYWDYG